MKLITRDTDYAVRALCFIAARNRRVAAGELVHCLKIPRPFLRKILQQLNYYRVLKSYKGKNGGFFLVKPAEQVFLLDLIRIFQGQLKLNECIFKRALCLRRKFCGLKKRIDVIEEKVISDLSKISVMMLLRDGGFDEKYAKNYKNRRRKM